MPKLRLPIAFLMLAIAVLALPLIASADNQWGKYAWPTDGGPVLTLGNNLDTLNWDASLMIANVEWNKSKVINNSIVPGRTNAIDCNPATGEVEVCNSEYGVNGWLGIAGIWIAKGKQITRGYVKVNDSYFKTAYYNNSDWRELVMCQEVGHIFGLAHQDETFDNANLGTCMDYTDFPDGGGTGGALSNLKPNDHDKAQLLAMYGADDGGKGGGKDGGGGKPNGKGKPSSPPGNDISQWGKAISTDGKGRPDLFELDLGGGNKLFTHVIWAN